MTLTTIGALYDSSGTTDVLRDGIGRTNHDSSGESLFLADDTANGCLLMDLGREVPITKINTYSSGDAHRFFHEPAGTSLRLYAPNTCAS